MEFRIKAKLITTEDLRRIITRLAHEILEKNRGTENLAIIGIRTRGAYLAERIRDKIKEIEMADEYDFVVINDNLEDAVEDILAIIQRY